MTIRQKTGGCCPLNACPFGLFEFQNQLYLHRGKYSGKYITVLRCADAEKIRFGTEASVYPVEVRA